MNILEYYYKKIIVYDLINKFSYNNLKKVPELKKIILNFGCKNFEIKNIASSLLSLELITAKRGTITKSKQANILLKIRKGTRILGPIPKTLKKKKFMKFVSLSVGLI